MMTDAKRRGAGCRAYERAKFGKSHRVMPALVAGIHVFSLLLC